MAERFDVIVIGSGAGGGTVAHTLAAGGKRILLLERGDFLPRERDNWEPAPVFVLAPAPMEKNSSDHSLRGHSNQSDRALLMMLQD